MSTLLPASQTKTQPVSATYRIQSTVGYFAAFVVLGLAASVLGPTLSGLAQHTAVGLAEISFLFTARSLGYLIGASLGGRLYDRFPGHLLIAGMLAVMGVTLAVTPLIGVFWLLFGVMLVLGVGEGNMDAGCNTLLVWVHGERVGPFMNTLHFFFGLGTFFSPIIIARVLLVNKDISPAFWILAACVLPVIGWLLRLPSPVNQDVDESNLPVRADLKLAILVALFFFFYVGAEVGFGGWIFSYTTAIGIGSSVMAAYLTSAFWGSFTAGRLLSIPLATWLKPTQMLILDLAGCLVSIAMILIFRSSALAIWAGTIGAGLSMASIFPTTIILAGSRMTITGRVTGLFFLGSSLGGMTIPLVMGQLFEGIGPEMTMTALMTDLLIMVAFFAVMMIYFHRPAPDRTQIPG